MMRLVVNCSAILQRIKKYIKIITTRSRINMKKQEFINAVAEKLEITKKDAKETVEGVFEVVEDTLVEGKKVPLGNLGRFEVTERSARKGRNPQTGEEIQIPARNAVVYKASQYAKDLVN